MDAILSHHLSLHRGTPFPSASLVSDQSHHLPHFGCKSSIIKGRAKALKALTYTGTSWNRSPLMQITDGHCADLANAGFGPSLSGSKNDGLRINHQRIKGVLRQHGSALLSSRSAGSRSPETRLPGQEFSEEESETLKYVKSGCGVTTDVGSPFLAPFPFNIRNGRQVANAVAGMVILGERSATSSKKGCRSPLSSRKKAVADLMLTEEAVASKSEAQDVSQVLERQLSERTASTSKAPYSSGPTRRGKLEGEVTVVKPDGRRGDGEAKVVSQSAALKKLAEVHDTLLQSGKAEDCARLVQSMIEEGRWSAKQIDRALKGGRIIFFLALPRQPKLLPAALSYIRLLPVGPKDYTCVINACARARNVDSAIEVLEIMKERGVAASFFDYSGVISTAAKAGDYHRAMGLFQRAREEGVTDVSLWNALLEACKESGQFQRGYELFEEMQASGETANLTTFNTMVSLAAKGGDFPKALDFYHQLVSSGLSPDARTATVLFSAMAANPCPSVSPHSLYQELINAGVRPDSFMWSAFFNAVHSVQKPGELEAALEVYTKEVKPAAAARAFSPGDKRFVYSALLNACAKAGKVDYAFGIRNDMIRSGISPDAHASTSLIRACGEVFQVQRALEYFDEVSADPSSPAMHYGHNRPGGPLAVHNAILDVLVKAGEMTKAMEILEGMRESDEWKPNLIAYNTVLMGCAYNKQMTRAFLVYKQLQQQGLVPNQRTFMPLIDVCGRVGKLDRALSLLAEMKNRGLAPTRNIYTRLMEACSQSGVPEQAFGIFRQMMNDRILPTADSFAALLGACAVRADSEQAFKLWRYMWENGIEPNDTCYDLLIKVCSRAGKIEEALDVFKETVRKHNAVTVGSFNSLMLALCSSDGTRNVDRAVRVLSLCRSMGVEPNRRSLLILIEGLARDGQVEPAYQFHKELVSREWNSDQKPYGKLVSALCIAGQVGRAVRVVEYMEDHGVRLPVASLGHLVAGCARTGRLSMALELYDQVKAKAVAELARLKQTGGFRWVTNYRNPLAKIPALGYEALIEGCCGAGLVARAVEVIGDIQDVGVVVNKATLAYLVNVASSYPEEPYMYAVHAQLRKQLQHHKALYVDQSSTLAAMYKQAHVDLQDAETWQDSDGAPATGTTDGVAGGPELPTGYEMSADDEWGYDPEASNGYRVSIGGEGEMGDLKARQQSLKAKLRSRHTGELRGVPADAAADAGAESEDEGGSQASRHEP